VKKNSDFKLYLNMKPFTLSFLIILFSFFRTNGQAIDTLNFKSLKPNDFSAQFKKEEKAMLIDVREPFEFRSSRLKNAVNIPSSGDLRFAADSISKEKALFLYCTTGFRSKRVAKYFCNKGFTKVYSLEGGISAWKKNHMPVDKKRHKIHDTRLMD
jgi:rhodanese-related sulfurtransferase